jgi:hypothetical protein
MYDVLEIHFVEEVKKVGLPQMNERNAKKKRKLENLMKT